MKNTVNLDKFVALKEKELQEIRGGEMRRIDKMFINFLKRR